MDKKWIACRIIANVMTNRGFMNGWLGDTSDEFKLEQANALYDMRLGSLNEVRTATWWADMNRSNMVNNCNIPYAVIEAAFGYNPNPKLTLKACGLAAVELMLLGSAAQIAQIVVAFSELDAELFECK